MEFLKAIDEILDYNLIKTMYDMGGFENWNGMAMDEFTNMFYEIISIRNEQHTMESFIAKIWRVIENDDFYAD